MAPSPAYSIVDLSQEFGITLRTLRFYEEKGIVKPTRVGVTRLYSSQDRIKIQLTLIGKRLRLSIEQISKLFNEYLTDAEEEPVDANTLLSKLTPDEIQRQIDNLEKIYSSVELAIAELHERLGNSFGSVELRVG